MLFGGFGKAPPVGGIFACPICPAGIPPFGGIPGYNKFFGTFGKIPPFGGIPGYNPFIGTYPGICFGCI